MVFYILKMNIQRTKWVLETEILIAKYKKKVVEISQKEQKRHRNRIEKGKKKHRQPAQEVYYLTNKIPENRENRKIKWENGTVPKMFLNCPDFQVKQIQQVPREMDKNKPTERHIIVKFQNFKNKGKLLQTSSERRGKKITYDKIRNLNSLGLQ